MKHVQNKRRRRKKKEVEQEGEETHGRTCSDERNSR